MSNYNNLLKVQEPSTTGTRVTKVVKKPYGYRIQLFNHYITLFYVKLIVNPNGSAKAHWLVKKNYQADYRYTAYHAADGQEITLKQYQLIN